MDRIKANLETAFIDKKTLKQEGWKWHYRTKERARFWSKKFENIKFNYYPKTRGIQIDFSAPEVVYGHNLFDFAMADREILFTKLDVAAQALFPEHPLPSVREWSVSYIEFTKNFICYTNEEYDYYFNAIESAQSFPYMKSNKINRYPTGIFVANGSGFIRAYDKKAEMIENSTQGNKCPELSFNQVRFETGYKKGAAIYQKYKTRKLDDILNNDILIKEINALMRKFNLPSIENNDFYLTKERQRCHISAPKELEIIRCYLDNKINTTVKFGGEIPMSALDSAIPKNIITVADYPLIQSRLCRSGWP